MRQKSNHWTEPPCGSAAKVARREDYYPNMAQLVEELEIEGRLVPEEAAKPSEPYQSPEVRRRWEDESDSIGYR